MQRVSRVVALTLLVAGMGLAAVQLNSCLGNKERFVDLAVQGLRLKIHSDRRLTIAVDVENRAADMSPPFVLFVHSVALKHTDRLPPLGPGRKTTWEWNSPPLVPGDYEIVASVEHAGNAFDADESRGVARALLHIPSASTREHASDGAMARVPSVVGLDRMAALQQLGDAGFAGPEWYERAEGPALDRVSMQWPEAGQRTAQGTRPVLVASASRTVPDLLGLPFEQARDRLQRAGLTPGELRVKRSMRYSTRRVLAQEPAPGGRVDGASAVALIVSDPVPWWPSAISGLMLILALGVHLAGRGHRVIREIHATERLPEPTANVTAFKPPPVVRSPVDQPLIERFPLEPPALVLEVPEPSPRPPTPRPPPEPATFTAPRPPTIADLRIVSVQGVGQSEVSWPADIPATTVAFRVIRDRGTSDVHWHFHDGSTT